MPTGCLKPINMRATGHMAAIKYGRVITTPNPATYIERLLKEAQTAFCFVALGCVFWMLFVILILAQR